jgi:hypothetical protein
MMKYNKHFMLSQLLLSVYFFSVYSQQPITGIIENMPSDKPPMNIVLFMFGMDDPVKVGEVDQFGNIKIDFPEQLPNDISTEIKDQFTSELIHTFHFSCMDRDIFNPDTKAITAFKGGYFSLSHSEELWEGTLFPVSDTALVEWLEDPHYQNPVISSFWEVIYSTQEINLDVTCLENVWLGEKEVAVQYHYDMQLKEGFNMIEYHIEAIMVSDISDVPSVPSVVKVTNNTDFESIKWVSKYYY